MGVKVKAPETGGLAFGGPRESGARVAGRGLGLESTRTWPRQAQFFIPRADIPQGVAGPFRGHAPRQSQLHKPVPGTNFCLSAV